MSTNWIQSNWRRCHPVFPLDHPNGTSYIGTATFPLLTSGDGFSPGKTHLTHWATGVSIKQHNGKPADDRLTNTVKKNIQIKQRKNNKNTQPEESQYQVWLSSFIVVTSTSITSQSHFWLYVVLPSPARCRSIGDWRSCRGDANADITTSLSMAVPERSLSLSHCAACLKEP